MMTFIQATAVVVLTYIAYKEVGRSKEKKQAIQELKDEIDTLKNN